MLTWETAECLSSPEGGGLSSKIPYRDNYQSYVCGTQHASNTKVLKTPLSLRFFLRKRLKDMLHQHQELFPGLPEEEEGRGRRQGVHMEDGQRE